MTKQADPAVLRVDDLEVIVEGSGTDVVLMIHGWPDTHHLWDGTVQALRADWRCARFTLPGFDVSRSAGATPLAEMTALFLRIADAVSPGQPVTLLLHDWGCIFGYEFAMQHPERVARIVAVDIGDHNSGAFLKSLTARARFQVLAYQLWLALAWKIGGSLGTWMTRWMARNARCPSEPARMGWSMNYPYAMRWLGAAGGLRGMARIEPVCPVLYLYGERKPFMFHSPRWLERVAAAPGSAVQGFRSGHWVMLNQAEAFHQAVAGWLAQRKG